MAILKIKDTRAEAYSKAMVSIAHNLASEHLLDDTYVVSRERISGFSIQFAIFDRIKDTAILPGQILEKEEIDLKSIQQPGEYRPVLILTERRDGTAIVSVPTELMYAKNQIERINEITYKALRERKIRYMSL
ncbi:MAG: hypothetical protein ACREBF_03490 [Candidatus Micrarchaeales archaeon]